MDEPVPPKPPQETPRQRVDREWMDLIQEIRMVLPGVQILFAFLLTVPFDARFALLHSGPRHVFLGAIVVTAVATALLMAPGTYHRLAFRRWDKSLVLRLSNYLTVAGSVLVAGAVGTSVYVVGSLLLSGASALLLALIIGLVYAALWFALPLFHRKPR